MRSETFNYIFDTGLAYGEPVETQLPPNKIQTIPFAGGSCDSTGTPQVLTVSKRIECFGSCASLFRRTNKAVTLWL
jgi:hypothetical protein